MHKDDLMTPKERNKALVENREADRLPIFISISSLSGVYGGFNYKEAFSNEKNITKSLVASYRKIGQDSISLGYGLHGIGRALGSKLNSPLNSVPSVEKHLLENLDSISNIDFEKTQLDKDDNLKIRYTALEMINEEVGNEVGLSFGITGPFTSAVSIIPLDKILRLLRKDPENVHKLLEIVTNCLIGIIDSFALLENVSISIADPIASGSILSPKQYKEFVLPYTKRMIEKIHGFNKKTSYHICGNTNNILELMTETKTDSISLDNVVDLGFAKEKIGKKVKILGNVDPVDCMLLGNEKTIDNAIKTCFKKAYNSEKGFSIATGCDVPLNTPLKNVDYYMKSCRKYAKCPVNESMFLGD